jgi:hypothetical protein
VPPSATPRKPPSPKAAPDLRERARRWLARLLREGEAAQSRQTESEKKK